VVKDRAVEQLDRVAARVVEPREPGDPALVGLGVGGGGDPQGVAPDLAREIATRLDVPLKYVPFKSPGELADKATSGVWDIGLIGAEPQRAQTISFSPAYAEIEATYLLPSGSPLKTLADVDAPGVRIAVTGRAAYGLWLDRNIKHAELVRSETLDSAYQQFVSGFACTGSQELSENWQSGDQVNFDLAATDNCTGAVQDFSGTDTVQGGLIVAADVSQS